MHKQHLLIGSLYGVLSSFIFVAMSILAKCIGENASTATILFARFFISFLVMIPLLVRSPKEFFPIREGWTMFLRSLLNLGTFALFFSAIPLLTLTNTLLLNSTSPLFVPLMAFLFIGVKTPLKVLIGIFIGFLGVAFVLEPNILLLQGASLVALASGLGAAITFVLVRTLTKKLPIKNILFYNFLFCSLVSAIFLPINWKPLDIETLLLLFLLGLLSPLYQLTSTLSLAKAPVRIVSFFSFLSIPLAALADLIGWKELPSLLIIVGTALVILGGFITIHYGNKQLL